MIPPAILLDSQKETDHCRIENRKQNVEIQQKSMSSQTTKNVVGSLDNKNCKKKLGLNQFLSNANLIESHRNGQRKSFLANEITTSMEDTGFTHYVQHKTNPYQTATIIVGRKNFLLV